MSAIKIDDFTTLEPATQQQLQNAIENTLDINIIGFDGPNASMDECLKNHCVRWINPPFICQTIDKLTTQHLNDDIESTGKQQTTTQTLKLLVVEDNLINQQVSIEMLEKMGHVVDIVDSAEQAMTLLNQHKYDILCTDYHLPGMDGLELIKQWPNPDQTPIIIMTADLTDAVFQHCQQLNINNIVTKPYTQKTLLIAIDKAIKQSRDKQNTWTLMPLSQWIPTQKTWALKINHNSAD